MRKFIIGIVILVIILGIVSSIHNTHLPFPLNPFTKKTVIPTEKIRIVSEENVTVETVKKVGPSVVTVASQTLSSTQPDTTSQLDPFGFFNQTPNQSIQPQSIGSGFIASKDGIILTNKHVVSDLNGKYQVITANDKKYDVAQIYRDPLNDIAILKIDPNQNASVSLEPVTLGDSAHLQVGQYVLAIGTALGEFRNSATTGIISGLGRGITAGSQFEGFVERLDNVIQTSAAINPGNSGGPLLNSSGQVIGINTAVAQNGQNIGFALPINTVKDSLNNFNQTGQFNRPSLGVSYKSIAKDIALLNDVPQGAYIQQVIPGSAAEKAGLKAGDIIVKIDGTQVTGTSDTQLAGIIGKKKPGDSISITYWRDTKTQDVQVILGTATNQ